MTNKKSPDPNQDFNNFNGSKTNSRFVELYLAGINITISIDNPLILNGLIEGNITYAPGGVITTNQYIVFYDSTRDLPICYKCTNDTCPDKNGDGLCDNSLYISCNGINDQCTFPNILDNNNWFIR